MKIELRKVAHYPRLSEETEAFNAEIYIDGVKRGDVKNDGHGGMNMIYPHTLEREIDEYAKTLPPDPPLPGYESIGAIPWTADYLISHILEEHLLKKELEKRLKKNTLFVKDGKCYAMKAPARPREAVAHILNDLPIDEAIKLYKQFAK